MESSSAHSHRTWSALQEQIAGCMDCVHGWPNEVVRPLAVSETPSPPERIKLLFIGVAPTAADGKNQGSHFYSTAGDSLRVGLFKLLDGPPFGLGLLPANRMGLREGNSAFHEAGFFFVHAAKVRPIRENAPPVEAILFCAKRHLRAQIELLLPGAVCFLGKNSLTSVAMEVFGRAVTGGPVDVRLGRWRGCAAVADQPIRGRERKTRPVVEGLLARLDTARDDR